MSFTIIIIIFGLVDEECLHALLVLVFISLDLGGGAGTAEPSGPPKGKAL